MPQTVVLFSIRLTAQACPSPLLCVCVWLPRLVCLAGALAGRCVGVYGTGWYTASTMILPKRLRAP